MDRNERDRADAQLLAFMRESLRIEGIIREPTAHELERTKWFIGLEKPEIINLCAIVGIYQSNAQLRDRPGINVQVNNHIAPPGGPWIATKLHEILATLPTADPWDTHVAYERLHPFTDGNGRSGRTLWAWQMVRRQEGLPLGFLHQWYYQSLERNTP